MKKRGSRHNLNIDTSTPAGIFVYTMLSALAEFERRTLSQRTKEGLAAARIRGARIGRPPRLDDAQVRAARSRIERDNVPVGLVAAELGVPRWTLARSIKRLEGVTAPTVAAGCASAEPSRLQAINFPGFSRVEELQ